MSHFPFSSISASGWACSLRLKQALSPSFPCPPPHQLLASFPQTHQWILGCFSIQNKGLKIEIRVGMNEPWIQDPWQAQAWPETVVGQIVTSLCSPECECVGVGSGGLAGDGGILLRVRCGTGGLDLQ